MMRQHLINTYLDYVNNWLTLGKFAEFHELTLDDAQVILQMGKRYHEEYVELMKLNIPVHINKE